MVFSSITFLLYFLPAFLALYYIAPVKYRNLVLLLSSIVFYSWGAPRFIFVILATTFVDFHLVKKMQNLIGLQKKVLLAFSVGINLSLLVYFKYSNFFIDNVNVFLEVLGTPSISWAKLALPIGISFYTFESITYSVDVYRGIHKPLKKFWDYQLYIILFPKLIAGPIVRYHDIAGQLSHRFSSENLDNFLSGFYRFCIGLSKKVLIANVVGLQADNIINGNPNSMSSTAGWVGILAYTMQIYFDFSGYSDMAIGLCRMVGFKIPENFNSPYTASSITEFWRKWHISLGRWMRDYLYIPLGGNRTGSQAKFYRNLWIVFLVSGIWHGASWNFVLWGAYHGLFIILERGILGKFYAKIGRFPAMVITFMIVMLGWIFFRIESTEKAMSYVGRLFDFSSIEPWYFDLDFTLILLVAFFFSLFSFGEIGKEIEKRFYATKSTLFGHTTMTGLCVVLLLFCISSITSSGFNPFIYFRF